ncbi:aminoglycoside phosphotransferase family protein, partial [Streptomyces sp. SID339]
MALEPPQRLVTALGETAQDGDDWLDKLPGAVEKAVALRGLTVERVHVPGGRSSLVLMVRRSDDTPAVLKLVPSRSRPESERAALAHWNGLGAVRLLDPECADGALLMERLHRDVSVRSLPEAKALLEAAGTLRRLWVEPPAGHRFETVAERTGRQADAMRASASA